MRRKISASPKRPFKSPGATVQACCTCKGQECVAIVSPNKRKGRASGANPTRRVKKMS